MPSISQRERANGNCGFVVKNLETKKQIEMIYFFCLKKDQPFGLGSSQRKDYIISIYFKFSQ